MIGLFKLILPASTAPFISVSVSVPTTPSSANPFQFHGDITACMYGVSLHSPYHLLKSDTSIFHHSFSDF